MKRWLKIGALIALSAVALRCDEASARGRVVVRQPGRVVVRQRAVVVQQTPVIVQQTPVVLQPATLVAPAQTFFAPGGGAGCGVGVF